MDELVVIDIFGEEYRFKPDHQVQNPEKAVQRLKKYIRESESQFQSNRSDKGRIIILLLAAMNLSRDLYELETRCSEIEKGIDRRVSSILEKISKGVEINTDSRL